jgi:uncharacterized short protein YbdD (DUF466 family)
LSRPFEALRAACAWAARAREAIGLIVGVPSYRRYCEHRASHHPDLPVMSRVEFFDARQRARYDGKSGGRCC